MAVVASGLYPHPDSMLVNTEGEIGKQGSHISSTLSNTIGKASKGGMPHR